MAKNNQQKPKKLSKRARRQKVIIYVMVIAMALSALTTGLAIF
ncbi:MAG TPA: stressosome-associated protein Prli42 [Pseudogracilibacillus sp.]|nr:stressosome-associated protein Prli42 [Pseudogracilibacillus sp.]